MKKAEIKDIVQGKEIYIYFSEVPKKLTNNHKQIVRKRLTALELKKHGITWQPIEESQEDYDEYIRILKLWCKKGFIYLNDKT